MKKFFGFILLIALIVGGYLALNHLGIIPDLIPGLNLGEQTVRTTITKDEWLGMMESENFTVKMKMITIDTEGVEKTPIKYDIKMNETAMYGYTMVGNNEQTSYAVKIGDSIYNINKINDKFVATASEGATDNNLKFEKFFDFGDEPEKRERVFDDFVYDEETKSYKGTLHLKFIGTADVNTEIHFENGVATKLYGVYEETSANGTVGRMIIEASDFGDTKITLPKYWVKMSKEDWTAAFGVDNFTGATSMQYSETVTSVSTYKYTATASYAETRVTNGTNVMSDTKKYVTKIDGVTYNIDKTNDGYVASLSDTEFAPQTSIMDAEMIDKLYENLSYDEESGLYISEVAQNNVTYKFRGKIANGKFTEINCDVTSNEGLPATIVINNIGTTVIEIPEYTLAE